MYVAYVAGCVARRRPRAGELAAQTLNVERRALVEEWCFDLRLRLCLSSIVIVSHCHSQRCNKNILFSIPFCTLSTRLDTPSYSLGRHTYPPRVRSILLDYLDPLHLRPSSPSCPSSPSSPSLPLSPPSLPLSSKHDDEHNERSEPQRAHTHTLRRHPCTQHPACLLQLQPALPRFCAADVVLASRLSPLASRHPTTLALDLSRARPSQAARALSLPLSASAACHNTLMAPFTLKFKVRSPSSSPMLDAPSSPPLLTRSHNSTRRETSPFRLSARFQTAIPLPKHGRSAQRSLNTSSKASASRTSVGASGSSSLPSSRLTMRRASASSKNSEST